MSNNQNENAPPRQPTVDEQVSLMLAHFNRANNLASKEAESALIKVVSGLIETRAELEKVKAEFAQYKKENPMPKDLNAESIIAPPKEN